MEIIARGKPECPKFRVVRPFMKSGKPTQVGEEIEIEEADQSGYVERGQCVPCDLPDVGVYICLRPFSLPGRTEKHEAKLMELVSLKAEDALALMLQGMVIPRDDHRWRPRNRRLKTTSDDSRKLMREATLDDAVKKEGIEAVGKEIEGLKKKK